MSDRSAHLVSRTLHIKGSDSVDVVSYNLFVSKQGDPLPTTPTANVLATRFVPDDTGHITLDLSTVSELAGLEGTYTVDVTAVDGVGNESPSLDIPNTVFDLSPPNAPTDGSVS